VIFGFSFLSVNVMQRGAFGRRVLLVLLVCVLGLARAGTIRVRAEHTVAVTPDGHIWTWGNGTRQCSDGTTWNRAMTDALLGLTDIGEPNQTLALDSDGTGWAGAPTGMARSTMARTAHAPQQLLETIDAFGRISDWYGCPLPGAKVSVISETGQQVASTTTGQEGDYE
jgi:hypothetical protein